MIELGQSATEVRSDLYRKPYDPPPRAGGLETADV